MTGPRPETLVRPEILAAEPYQVQPAGDCIKLDAMEAPAGLPADLLPAWYEKLAQVAWNRYPDGAASKVAEGLRRIFSISDHQSLLLGNGSDEIIQMLALAMARPGARMLTVAPGFAIFRLAARTAGMDCTEVDLDPRDFSLDRERILNALAERQPALTFIANPNNPTGNLFPRELLLEIAQASPGLLVVDEAYFPYTDESLLDRAGRPSNLVVLRTLSKAGMAGLRLGWLTGAPQWIEALDRIRMPYNINALTQAAVSFALDHPQWWREMTVQVRAARAAMYHELVTMPGVTVWPSEANFLLVRVSQAHAVHAALREAGVLVKCLDGQHPGLEDCLRLTVGTPEENQAMLQALGRILR